MSGKDPGYTAEELLATVIAKEIRDGEITAVGTLSPIPAAAAYLAKATSAPKARLIVLDGDPWPFTGGSKEFFDLAQRGRLDLFFLSGAQIDRHGNINLTAIGDYDHPRVRLPGGAGSAMLYYCARRVILFKTDHTKRTFVAEVDFKTSPGGSPANVHRPGGPAKVVPPLCVFAFAGDRQSLVLEALHPGVTIEQVAANTDFDIDTAAQVAVTAPPSTEELRILRTVVREQLKALYPDFVAKALRPA